MVSYNAYVTFYYSIADSIVDTYMLIEHICVPNAVCNTLMITHINVNNKNTYYINGKHEYANEYTYYTNDK